MSNYRLDKSYFKAQTFEEAENKTAYWRQKSISERLQASWFLTCCAYGYYGQDQPRMKKNVFSMRKHQL